MLPTLHEPERCGSFLDRYVVFPQCLGTEGLAAGVAATFINSAQDLALLGTEHHALPSLSVPPHTIPCFSGCIFVILHVAFFIAKNRSESLSDVGSPRLLFMGHIESLK